MRGIVLQKPDSIHRLEICCGDPASVAAAIAGGASRIELCSGLSDGGLTPSAATIETAVASGLPEVNVLIRPRPGDFLYSRHEISVMERDIEFAVASGATGVVIGALTPDGDIDTDICGKLISKARSINPHANVTFHRAFDLVRNPDKSLEEAISLGCDCLLTSGLAPTAQDGIVTLRELVRRAAGRLMIMAGCGVNADNAATIIRETGVDIIHSTARGLSASGMRFRRDDVPMGAPGSDEYARMSTSSEKVAELIEIINRTTTL